MTFQFETGKGMTPLSGDADPNAGVTQRLLTQRSAKRDLPPLEVSNAQKS